MNAASSPRTFRRPEDIPPLRDDPFEDDPVFDDQRAAWVQELWHSQDDLLRGRDRQVEENIRMLLGQQWIVWSDLRQRFVDLADTLSDDEKRWRHMPVLNRLMLWYMLIHARMTENPPVITWQPGPDRIDAMLAEVMDPVFRHLWRETEMLEVLDRLFSWLIPSGAAFLKSRINPTKGDAVEMKGPAILQLLDANGDPVMGPSGEVVQRMTDEPVPFDEDGSPLARLLELEGGQFGFEPTGDPHVFHEGGLEVDVLTCLEVRGEWGPTPWHKKAYHVHRSLMTPLQAWETFGIELEPDVRGESSESLGIIHRLLHGSGLFGAADGDRGTQTEPGTEFVTVYECWQPPGRMEGTQKTKTNPGGRLTIVTGGGKVLRDGPRTAKFRYVSPIRSFGFVNLPGRPQDSSPQEMLNGPIRTRNRMHAQVFQHATLLSNPRQVVNRDAGIEDDSLSNLPGETVYVNRDRVGSAPVIEYISAPGLGRDVYEAADRLKGEIDELGQMAGTEGSPPTDSASGELVKELRFNSDRFIGSTLKRAVLELGRLAEDWMVMIPTIWDEEKVISVAGEDGIARTYTVFPHLFEEGSVNVEPEIESMLPEGRGERQKRVARMYETGMFGQPGTPEAVNTYLDLARFPHMSRAVRPGGTDRTTAEQNVGRLLQGTKAEEIPMFDWYDHGVHLFVLERFMKSPEYLKLDLQKQHQFVLFRQVIKDAQLMSMILAAKREMMVQGQVAREQMGEAGDLRRQAKEEGLEDDEAQDNRNRASVA